MKVLPAIVAAACFGIACGKPAYSPNNDYDTEGPAAPYEFSYSAGDADGHHSHSQTSDGNTVRGHYMIQMADGTMRKVEYHADETGFHAKIVTNELGTESKNPADVIIKSTAPTGAEAASFSSNDDKYAWN